MENETNITIKYDPWNGNYVVEQPEKDVIRVERWIVALIMKQLDRGEIEVWKP